MLFSCSWSLYC